MLRKSPKKGAGGGVNRHGSTSGKKSSSPPSQPKGKASGGPRRHKTSGGNVDSDIDRGESRGRPASVPASTSVVAHNVDDITIVNATAALIRQASKNKCSSDNMRQLVRVPSWAERCRLYAEAAEAVGRKESSALPTHGGRSWKCEVKISDATGASGDNGKVLEGAKKDSSTNAKTKGKKPNFTLPLFRWFRGNLELACLPHLLESIVTIEHKFSSKKRWHGISDDEDDSSDEEDWDDCLPEANELDLEERKVSALSVAAWENATHPIPHVLRVWISPNLQRFQNRKAATDHAEVLVERDLIIDRTLFGYAKSGVRLRPAKPSRKQALEAGTARFLRDGLWIVGQEETWIDERRKKLNMKIARQEERDESENDDQDIDVPKKEGGETLVPSGISTENITLQELAKSAKKRQDSTVVTPPESSTSSDDASFNEVSVKIASKTPTTASALASFREKQTCALLNSKLLPPIAKSTHWRLPEPHIDKCYAACMDHFDKVMRTVKARSLHHELADGFDVFRERGHGRYDMEPQAFDTDAFSFLTNPDKAPWMPVVRAILGDDALLVHKGCFLSCPGSATQVYHQDGLHLTTKYQKPCHAVNLFIPLVDCNKKMGPTEFCLGSHYLGYENWNKGMLYLPCVKAGTPIIFDYRLGHRGLGNSSQYARPVVYLTYSAVSSGKEFHDSVNFSKKRYRKLGEFVEPYLSREERANKRTKKSKKTAERPKVEWPLSRAERSNRRSSNLKA